MRVLVTGASGMLGGAVARLLADRGDEVTVLQRRSSSLPVREVLGDVADPDAVHRAVAGQDGIVHLAAKVNVVGPWADYERVNVGGTRHVVEAATAQGVGRLVYVSSPSVAHAGSSISGEGAGPADPERARGPYSRSKAIGERIALAADGPTRDGVDLAVVAVRPHLVWGPGDTQLVGRIVGRARAGRLPIIGSGAPLIDTTYVDNAADALVEALDRAPLARGEAYVVTDGTPRPVGEVLDAWARAGGATGPSRRVPSGLARAAGSLVDAGIGVALRLGHDVETDPPITRFLAEQLSTAHWFDQRRTRAALDWAPRVGRDEGLRRLAASYAADTPDARERGHRA
ncbi:NAD-dependent epimerase/dehydratase family protein [Agilicoccus flavus]|uniref:NAD-dependent epimerase/dehydratase family protein n=1 Tax=Agilicoccus flavus TaxID=2775968 RepID=UPI001CF65F31|nr:NAD-dependent epimerase/dehydratase family protein [Agilicoccus flavus]